ASDVFSAGLLLYELLTGHPVFADLEDQVSASALLYAPLPDPREQNPTLDPALAELVQEAVSRDSHRRLTNAGEFARRLEVVSEAVRLQASDRADFLDWIEAQLPPLLPSPPPPAAPDRAAPPLLEPAPVPIRPMARREASTHVLGRPRR